MPENFLHNYLRYKINYIETYSLNYTTYRRILQLYIAKSSEMYYNKPIETNEREINMPFDLKTLLIVGGIMIAAIILIGLFLYLFFRSTFYSIRAFFITDNGKTGEHEKLLEPVTTVKRRRQKSVSEPLVEVCTLVRKSDDRLRIIEKDGTEKITDSYYELVFDTRKHEELRIVCSAEVYDKIPFEKEGALTYRRNTLVKFKYYEKKKEIIISD